MTGTTALAVVERADGWRSALESAVRAEFLGSPLYPPAGSPLAYECGVEGCCRPAGCAPWGGVGPKLCWAHGQRWAKAGRPAKDEWVSAQPPGSPSEASRRCLVAGCLCSAASGGLCFTHRNEWRRAGAPERSEFAGPAVPAPAGEAL